MLYKPARSDSVSRETLVSCRLTKRGADTLTAMAAHMGISRAELMRRAIAYYVPKQTGYRAVHDTVRFRTDGSTNDPDEVGESITPEDRE